MQRAKEMNYLPLSHSASDAHHYHLHGQLPLLFQFIPMRIAFSLLQTGEDVNSPTPRGVLRT